MTKMITGIDFGTAYMDLSEDYFKLSDIVNYNGKSYFVDTCYAADVKALETMVFSIKKFLPENYDPFEEPEKFEEMVEWGHELFVTHHKDKSEARRVHMMVVENLRKYGEAKGALN